MDTVEGLRDAARRARECAVIGQAVTLARWIENGNRPVTVGRVLRKADVPAAGAALGVDVPSRLRTMADIRALHRPWCAAIATGLLQVSDGSVTAGPALECWPPDDAGLLAGWLAGLRAVCAAESYPQDEDSVRLVALALLTVLGVVIQVLFGWDGDHLHVFQKGRKRYGDPFVNLEGTGDEEAVRVRDALVPGATIPIPMTSGPAGSTRSRWRRPSRTIAARTTRSVWSSGATPPSNTGTKTSPRNRSRSA